VYKAKRKLTGTLDVSSKRMESWYTQDADLVYGDNGTLTDGREAVDQ